MDGLDDSVDTEKKSSKEAGEKIIKTARDRLARAISKEHDNRVMALEDLRFAAPGVLEQWPIELRRARENDPNGARPCLTNDKTNQYINQVKNDQRQNSPSMKVRPVDDKADEEVAGKLDGLLKHIEDISSADIAYDTAFEFALRMGFGFFRIVSEYCDDESFDQDIYIRRITNPFSAYLDDNHTEPDGSDAQWGFVLDDIPYETFEAEHPDADRIDFNERGVGDDEWFSDETLRICEYYYFESSKKKIYLFQDGSSYSEDHLPDGYDPSQAIKTKTGKVKQLKWVKMNGAEILERRDLPGKYIPIVPVYGNEINVDGKRVISGLIHAAKDAMRRHNYETSAYVERVALSPKAPFIAAAGQVEDFADMWSRANQDNISVLTYNPIDINGTALPAPQRQTSVDVPMGLVQSMQQAEHDIQASMGMYSASLGEKSNEKSGVAINARKREGDVATFHYIDNLSRSVRQCGRICLQWIPVYYDTERTIRILGDDGVAEQIILNPAQQTPVAEYEDAQFNKQKSYNIQLGKYDVSVSTGPSYTTQRQEAGEFMTELARSYPPLMDKAGDIVMRNMDVHGAEELAERLKKFLPPNITQDEDDQKQAIPPQAQAQMQQQDMALHQAMDQIDQLKQQLRQNQTEQAKTAVDAQKVEVEKAKVGTAQEQEVTKRMELELKQQELALKREEMMRNSHDQAQAMADNHTQMVLPQIEQLAQLINSGFQQVIQSQAESQQQIIAGLQQLAQPKHIQMQYDETGRPIGAVASHRVQ